jgi:glycosyltransferase involved in cell wall biosynthesis
VSGGGGTGLDRTRDEGRRADGAHVLVALEPLPHPFDVRVRAIVEALVDAGYDVSVVCPTGHGHEQRSERIGPVRVERFRAPPGGDGVLGYLREYVVSLWRLVRVARRIERERPIDLVIVCNPPDLLAGLKFGLRHRPRLLFDYRETCPELFAVKFQGGGVRERLLHQALLISERFAFHCADAVITVSNACADLARGRGKVLPERLFMVGNGPDARRIFPVPPRPELRHGHDRLVLWLGAMSRQEGLQGLIDAADALVNGRGRGDVGFALVGPGDVHEELTAEIAARGLGDVIHLSGAVGDEMVRSYMATADVCVGVDVSNSFNALAAMRKILEYMAMGRAVAQYPLIEMRGLCGDTTAYAEDGDPADLARVIGELLDDDGERERLGREARERVEAGLMWHDQVPQLLAAVETALEPRAQSSRRR